ncbi:MAG: hypothetical protein WC796_04430 [Candidatus Pacearchaeota archaeon]|jgi:hypothetical protein
MKSREPEQLNFEFIAKLEAEERESRFANIMGVIGCASAGMLTFLGLSYLKVTQPECLEGLKNALKTIYATYPGPY